MASIKTRLKETWLYAQYREYMIKRAEYALYLKEATRRFSEDKPSVGSLEDYKKALSKYRVTYDEYMYRYDMWRLSEKARAAFVSQAEMEKVYRVMVKPEVKDIFCDKVRFLKKYRDFVSRKWVFVPEASYQEFKDLVISHDCIVKPIGGHSGAGIFKIEMSKTAQLPDDDLKKMFNQFRDEKRLVEECIFACSEIESFHPSSLNTIRVVTISRGEDVRFIGSILRMGAHNSFVDNTHAGGVFAQINLETGIIESDGVDTDGNRYDKHPDTGIVFKGTQIPYWEKVKEACRKACVTVPNICFAGWDICILPDGGIELIEGNYAPHFDGGMQVPLKLGAKEKVKTALRELYGVKHLIR